MHFPDLAEFEPEASIQRGRGGVYLLYSGSMLVYVGQTQDLTKRLAQHRAERVKEFDMVLIYHEDDLASRLRIEGILHLKYLPRYNHAILLGTDGLTGKVWERDHKNIWVKKRTRRKGPGSP